MKNKETYIAIDFEHVTEIQAICQVGYVYVVDGQPAEYNSTYINPMVGDFSRDPASRFVHHITPDDVVGKETFSEFWKRFIKIVRHGNHDVFSIVRETARHYPWFSI